MRRYQAITYAVAIEADSARDADVAQRVPARFGPDREPVRLVPDLDGVKQRWVGSLLGSSPKRRALSVVSHRAAS